jgi:hypothetical protein
MDKFKFAPLKPKNGGKLKFDNAIKVSYPDQLYEKIRRHAFRRGISLQEMQRKCAEFYINHLDHDEMEMQKVKRS